MSKAEDWITNRCRAKIASKIASARLRFPDLDVDTIIDESIEQSIIDYLNEDLEPRLARLEEKYEQRFYNGPH